MIKIKKVGYEVSQKQVQEFETILENLTADKSLGFHQICDRTEIWDSVSHFANKVKDQIETVCVVGIGGSHLGVEVIDKALNLQSKQVLFFDNLDPYYIDLKWGQIKDHKKAHFVIVSKSGTTLETLTLANLIHQKLDAYGLKLADVSSCVTELVDNPLYNWAQANDVPTFELSVDIGGRFSVLTPVGSLPAALMGLNIEELKKGAQWALDNKTFVAELTTQFYASLEDEKWVSMIWSYSDQLNLLGYWWQQLWAESLAKKEARSGQPGPRVSTPVACRGANDQHSLLQQVIEGTKDKFVTFLTVDAVNSHGESVKQDLFGNLKYTVGKTPGHILNVEAEQNCLAMSEVGVRTMHLTVDKVDTQTVGALFMVLQLLVGAIGEKLDINTYNQPGVELGKVKTKQELAGLS